MIVAFALVDADFRLATLDPALAGCPPSRRARGRTLTGGRPMNIAAIFSAIWYFFVVMQWIFFPVPTPHI